MRRAERKRLRRLVAQGERNSLASSEEIAAGAVLEFSVLVMADELVPAVKEMICKGIAEHGVARALQCIAWLRKAQQGQS